SAFTRVLCANSKTSGNTDRTESRKRDVRIFRCVLPCGSTLFTRVERGISKIHDYPCGQAHTGLRDAAPQRAAFGSIKRRHAMSTQFTSHTPRKLVSLGGLFLVLSMGTAAAQAYPREVVAHCARMVQKMPELGCTTCDGFRWRMEQACEANGGRI